MVLLPLHDLSVRRILRLSKAPLGQVCQALQLLLDALIPSKQDEKGPPDLSYPGCFGKARGS